MDRPADTPLYFGSWSGYQPPVSPRDPVDYEEAEARPAFSVFVYDDEGRVQSFEKWLVRAFEANDSLLDGRGLDPGRHFFAPDEADPERPGPRITLEDTRGLEEYFRATVGEDGSVAGLERVVRERSIRHEYTYWEDGGIKEFRYMPASGPGGVETYDRQGDLVSPETVR